MQRRTRQLRADEEASNRDLCGLGKTDRAKSGQAAATPRWHREPRNRLGLVTPQTAAQTAEELAQPLTDAREVLSHPRVTLESLGQHLEQGNA